MAVNTFISFFDKANGESTLKGKENWVEVFSWDWEVEAETSYTSSTGGTAVGKPRPGVLRFDHKYDTASHVILGYLCNGRAFPKMQLQMMKTAVGGVPVTYFTMDLEGVFITKVSNSSNDDGNVLQSVEIVFKTVKIDYRPFIPATGALGPDRIFSWDIPAGTALPNA
jgi:type VI secretion system Hcp family effector